MGFQNTDALQPKQEVPNATPYALCAKCGHQEPLPTDSCGRCWSDRLVVTDKSAFGPD